MKTMAQLARNAKRAQTVFDREEDKGRTDMSIRQTRRMYFAHRSLGRALGALNRARVSAKLALRPVLVDCVFCGNPIDAEIAERQNNDCLHGPCAYEHEDGQHESYCDRG